MAAGEIGYMLPGVQFLGQRYEGLGALEGIAAGSGVAERARRRLEDVVPYLPEIGVSSLGYKAAVLGAVTLFKLEC